MESSILGLVLDSSVLVAAERSRVTTPEVIEGIPEAAGDGAIVICSPTAGYLCLPLCR
jgi:hypothetical protein